MNDILELLPIPAERDFPEGRLVARRDALMVAVASESRERRSLRGAVRAARGHLSRTWLALIGVLAIGLALLATSLSGYPSRVNTSEALLTAAGTAQLIVVIAAPSSRVRVAG